MAKVRENKELLIEAKTKEEVKQLITKYRALGYKKNGRIEYDSYFINKLPYYAFMHLKKWG